MLNEICPVQFIEGVNEYAEPMNGKAINLKSYSGVAIEYIPKISYTLTRLDIFLTEQGLVSEGKYKVALCSSDLKHNPSDILLSEGEWNRKQTLGDWQQVELHTVVVRPKNKYWITIDLDKGYIGLPIAVGEDVIESNLRFRVREENWKQFDEFKPHNVMLRFYGRILPITS